MSGKKDNRARLEDLLGPASTNVLGTGLTMLEFVQLVNAERLAASWVLQSREECKRRRQAVIALSIELGRIQEKTGFATRLAELAIESVIEGNWEMVEEWAEHFAFSEDDAELRGKHAPTYAVFRELLLQVLRTGKVQPI